MKNVILLFLLCAVSSLSSAQVVSNVRPPADGKMGVFTEWQKVDVSFDDNSKAVIEYRIALVNRKGVGCHYDIEVKNSSDIKLNITLKSSYYDKLVKKNFGEEKKESLKPGKSVVVRFVAQGCKKEKGDTSDDYGLCMACDFGINIHVYKP